MDSKKARICELEFLELCTRIFAYRNNPTDIIKFLTFSKQFIDFDPRIISGLAKEIFDLKYVPSKEEKVQLLAVEDTHHPDDRIYPLLFRKKELQRSPACNGSGTRNLQTPAGYIHNP